MDLLFLGLNYYHSGKDDEQVRRTGEIGLKLKAG